MSRTGHLFRPGHERASISALEPNEEDELKYMLLMQRSISGYEEVNSMPPDDLKAHMEHMMALDMELRESGEHVDGRPLPDPIRRR